MNAPGSTKGTALRRVLVPIVVAVCAVSGLVGCGEDAPTPASPPTVTPSSPAASPSPTPTPAPNIAPSRPLEILLPKAGARIQIATDVCPVVDGMLDPDRRDYMVACYYVAPDKPYSEPGSEAPDIAVLAGHTWRDGPAAFNVLYDWASQAFTVAEGDEIWVRTEASGTHWLVYRAVSFHTPAKYGGLAADTNIWGEGPVPGRLLTIGCQQQVQEGVHSTNNIVVVWTYDRVADDAPA